MKELFQFIFENPEASQLKKQLQQTVLFQGLSSKELDFFVKKANVRAFKKGQHVFFEGDPGSVLYVILSGTIHIEKQGTKHALLATLTKGMFFGEVSLVDNSTRSASAYAAEDSKLFCFFNHDLAQIANHHPRLANKIYQTLAYILSQRLRLMNERSK